MPCTLLTLKHLGCDERSIIHRAASAGRERGLIICGMPQVNRLISHKTLHTESCSGQQCLPLLKAHASFMLISSSVCGWDQDYGLFEIILYQRYPVCYG